MSLNIPVLDKYGHNQVTDIDIWYTVKVVAAAYLLSAVRSPVVAE